MNNSNQDNIVAVATAYGYAGVGVIRISGYNLLPIINSLTLKNNIIARKAVYTDFYNKDNEIIDSGILLYFNAPNSFTGEEVVELQGHGSPVVLQMLLKRCLELECRMAEAGEFTRRAYLNGKLDLVQAESIIDLIHAESEIAAKSALKSLRGDFSRHIGVINEQLINLRMFVEATLDFPEEDIEFIANAKIKDKLTVLVSEINQLLGITRQGVLLNNGANIVIVGRPNVGKSSLLNALANEDIAIVTPVAGTTRDIIKEKIIINGIVFNLIDTAGIRDTHDIVEKIGIERALHALTSAEICLVLVDDSIGQTLEDKNILVQVPTDIPRIFVHNKIDLTNKNAGVEIVNNDINIFISAKNQIGIDLLRDEILKLVGFSNNTCDVFTARTRHLDAMKKAVNHVENSFNNWHNLEVLAEELRYAHNNLSEITGEFTADDLLGEIFSRFCIGK
ncbi:MAG: tRNA uridine-5-carboxymethylaminomethyl(34) synthesis GTPase MnmE [Burkholderiales bacterium]|nr:tRNA uridine-5-carboxymethylaminomethyl(34) synthesis GTPase MnmE [Burkholderiales bacterium]